MRGKRFFQKTRKKITINGSDTAGFDKSKVECYNCHKMGHFVRECRGLRNQYSINMYQDSSRRIVNVKETPPKAMVAIDGVGFDWSYMAKDEAPTNMDLMAFSEFEIYTSNTCSKICLKSYETLKKVSDNKDCSVESPVVVENKTNVPTIAKVEVVRPKQQEKLVRPREVNTVRPRAVNTARPRAVNTARPNSLVVNAVRANQETCLISLTSRNLMKDMLPLGEEKMVAKLLVKELLKLRNKSDLDTMSIDDLYNNFNIIKQEVKRTASSNSNSQNMVFVSSPSTNSTNDVYTAYGVSTASTQSSTASIKNKALVVKPHNKTPYELFRDEGYFTRYSMNSKAYRVYNFRIRRVEENLHIEFLENKPIVVGAGPEWLFNIDMLTKSMNYVPVIAGSTQDYIYMPLWKDGSPLFDSSPKISSDAEK
nr:hypothetical protein [Tanacetum cinerariifolium]